MKYSKAITTLFLIVISISCKTNTSNASKLNHEQVSIIGKTTNTKTGGAVISETDNQLYYVAGIDFWNPEQLGKSIVITGNLKITQNKAPKENEFARQQITGLVKTIIKPKWKLL